MKKTKWIVLTLAALLMLGLFAACKSDPDDVSPTPDVTPPTEETDPPISPSDPPEDTATPEPFVPTESVVFPDLDGFEKEINEFGGVSYNSETSTIMLDFFPATPEQLAEAKNGLGDALSDLLSRYYTQMEIVSEKEIDLPGLNRKGRDLELMFEGDALYVKGTVFPSEDQIVFVLGLTSQATKQELLDAYDEFLQALKLS